MRLYISAIVALGLSSAACGKKTEPTKPADPAKVEQPAEKPAEKPADPTVAEKPAEKPADPTVAEKPAEKPADPNTADKPPEAAADRSAGIQAALDAWSNGRAAETYGAFADNLAFHVVGAADPAGKPALQSFLETHVKAFPDSKFKASKVIETGDVQTVLFVMSGTNTGEMMGQPATNKKVSVAGAWVNTYGADGKIAKAEVYIDHGSVLAQLGLMPGQAADAPVTAAAWPESTEVIKGEANAANVETVKAFAGKIKADTIEAAVNEHFADDYTMIDPNGTMPPVTGKEAAIASFKAMIAMMPDAVMTVEESWSAGDVVVSRMTNTFTYKGGIPGVEAKDQKVTVHSVGISTFADGKFKTWTGYSNQLELMTQLGALGGAAEKPVDGAAPADAGAAFGVASCDAYLAKMTECVGAMPEAARGQVTAAVKQATDSWKQLASQGDAAKAALETACKQALDTSKQAMGPVCPAVKWE